MFIVDLYQGILDFFANIWNTINGLIHIFQSIFNLFGSIVSAIKDVTEAIYSFSPFVTVPISAIGVLLIITVVLSIIKKLPVM